MKITQNNKLQSSSCCHHWKNGGVIPEPIGNAGKNKILNQLLQSIHIILITTPTA
jgi:hypothetical protein